ERIPYFGEQIAQFLAVTEHLLLVGAVPPVSFFAYPGKPSQCVPEACQIHLLAQAHEDGARAMRNLADALDAPAKSSIRVPLQLQPLPTTGALTAFSVAQVIAHPTPDHDIYSEQ